MTQVNKNIALSLASMIEVADKNLETLKYVRLEFSETKLVAYATDRFVLARATYELDEPSEEFTAYLDKGAVKFIKDNAKTTHSFNITNTLVQTDSGHTYALITDGSTMPKQSFDSLIDTANGRTETPNSQVKMDLTLINRISKLMPPSQAPLAPAKRRADWRIRVGDIHEPILFNDTTGVFTALAQPMRSN